MSNKIYQQGFGIVEIIVAMAVFITIAITSVTVILQSFNINRLGNEETKANLYAQEGIEAVRSLKIRGWSNMDIGSTTCGATVTRGLTSGGGSWAFSGTSDIIGKYTRTITMANVCRDGSGNISDSGTTYDSDVKKVTTTIGWAFLGNRSDSIAMTTYLSQFDKAIVTGGPIMMAYSKTTTTPFYRTWDGSTWSAEGSANVVGGNINYIVLKSSRARNEAILGTQTSTGAIYIQVWDGTSWSNLTQVGTGSTTARSFDIAYEKTTGRALIVYSSGADFAYRIWDGSTLSAPITVTAPPTTGTINWIELRQNPLSGSDEIAFLMLDANADVYGMRWTGSTWNNMGTAAAWDATASTATRKGIDVEYEQTSGHIMFVWGDSVSTDLYYRTWNGTTLSAATLLDVPAMGGVANWVQLDARPSSDEILMGVQDAGADLNTRKWSGTAWDAAAQHPEHDATVENIASRNFDVIWETHSSNLGKAWLVWGDGATRSERQWSGTAWGTATVASGSDDTSFVRLRADPVSGAVFSGIYQCSCSSGANRDINERRLVGGSSIWSGSNQLWGGPTTADPAHFKVDIATP